MSELVVKDIYDQLYNLESKVKRDDVYPIHKRLVFDDQNGIKDIYGWLSKEIAFKEGEQVLDAGCGVGFGSCLLAKAHPIRITGISLSEKEVQKAKAFAQKAELREKVDFEVRSFDSLTQNAYDKIIAVESIKHSLDLSKTLGVMMNALLPGGTLFIIEDFYGQDSLTSDAKKYKRDWNMVDVFRLSDYYRVLGKEHTKYTDFAQYLPSKSKFKVNMKLFINNLISNLQSKADMNVNKIFRGGYYLDRLYLDGLMNYGLLAYTKPNSIA